jgi:hypothetical protein
MASAVAARRPNDEIVRCPAPLVRQERLRLLDLRPLDRDARSTLGDLLALCLDEGAGDFEELLEEADTVFSRLDLRLLERLQALGE